MGAVSPPEKPRPTVLEYPASSAGSLGKGEEAGAARGDDPIAEALPLRAASRAERPPENGEKRVYRVAALGDSLTDFRSGGGGYIKYLKSRCPRMEIVNWGKGGDMVNQMRRRLEASLSSSGSEALTDLLVFGGVNDLYSDETANRTHEKITSDLSAIYALAKARGLRVVAITVAPWGGFNRYFTPRRSENTLRVNEWIRAQEGELVDRVIDAYASLSCGNSERFCDAYELSRPDGLHFNSAGHLKLGETVFANAFQDCL